MGTDTDAIPDGWWKEPAEVHLSADPKTGKEAGDNNSLFIKAEKTLAWKTEIKNIKPNRYYLLNLWVKREGWRDGEYPFLSIFGQEIRMNELFSWGKWRKVTYLLNSGERHKTTFAFLSKGLSHKVSFRNLKLREFHFKFLTPPSGKVIRGGKPIFSWSIPSNNLVFKLIIEIFDKPSPIDFTSTKEARIELMSPQGSAIQIRKALPDGKWHWRIRAFLGRDEVARSMIQNFRVIGGRKNPSSIPSRVKLYPSVPPSVFFPIGVFSSNPDNFDELKKAGFNSVQSYLDEPKKIQEFLELASRAGLKALVKVPKFSDKTHFRKFVKKASSSSALLAWYIEDEPEGRGTSPANLWDLGLNLHKSGSNHPKSLTLLRSRLARYYGPATDIILVDPYPIPTNPITWLSDSIKNVHHFLGPKKSIWAIIQAFNWGNIPSYPKNKPSRFPSYEEERAMAFLAITHGVRGLFFFSEGRARKDPIHWNNLKKLAGELECFYPLLSSSSMAQQPTLELPNLDSSGKPTVHFLMKTLNRERKNILPARCPFLEKGRYLIVLNTKKKRTAIRLRGIKSNEIYALDLFTSDKLKLEGNEFRATLNPYGVRVWQLKSGQ